MKQSLSKVITKLTRHLISLHNLTSPSGTLCAYTPRGLIKTGAQECWLSACPNQNTLQISSLWYIGCILFKISECVEDVCECGPNIPWHTSDQRRQPQVLVCTAHLVGDSLSCSFVVMQASWSMNFWGFSVYPPFCHCDMGYHFLHGF